jgi:hypothetical protein
MTMPDSATITAWATIIATLWIAVQQQISARRAKKDSAITQDTNNLVNGQHGKALETIVTQAAQIAKSTGLPSDEQKLVEAVKAVADHSKTKS